MGSELVRQFKIIETVGKRYWQINLKGTSKN